MENAPYLSEIFQLEKGFSTYVYGLDDEFSDRIKMIVSFIRAIYAKPDFLVIDQTLDGFDEEFRSHFVNFLKQKCPRMGVILLTADQEIARVFSRSLNLHQETA